MPGPLAPLLAASASGVTCFAAGNLVAKNRFFDLLGARSGKPRVDSFQQNGLEDAIVIVDPISTGARLAFEAQSRGSKVIRIFSEGPGSKNILDLVPESCRGLTYAVTLHFNWDDPSATVRELSSLPYHIMACQVGCESGVEAYDQLTAAMPGFPSNGLDLSAARRDKYIMGESVRNAGLRAVKQKEVSKWDAEVLDFLSKELKVREHDTTGPWCVLKPTRSAASDGVYIAKCLDDAAEAFDRILGATSVFGTQNQSVLLQEFLKGKEYVVDSVSMEGEHKCVAIWEYDKRPCNGAPFVYFGMVLYQSENGERERRLVEYMHNVLDALGVRHGPSHGEVMWLEDEDAPCLVEVGARPHGGEGTFVDLAEPVLGFSQVHVMLDTFDKPHRFRRLPKLPDRFQGGAQEVFLVSRQSGFLAAYPLLEKIKRLRSFKNLELQVKVGSRIDITVDLMTTPGSIMLAHSDGKVVEEDSQFIRQLQDEEGFYQLAKVNALKYASPNYKLL